MMMTLLMAAVIGLRPLAGEQNAASGVPTLSLVPAREILASDIRRRTDEEGNLCLYAMPLLEKFSRDGFRASVTRVAGVDWK